MSEREWASVCSRSPEELRERIATVRTELLPRVVEKAKRSGGFTWEFEDTPELRRKLEELVALERQCCGGLSWTLEDLAHASRLRLAVDGMPSGS